MTSMKRYTITAAPKFAGMREWDCAHCGHLNLGKPVFVYDVEAGQLLSLGAGCAALAVFGSKRSTAKVRNEVATVESAAAARRAMLAERVAKYAQAKAALAAFDFEDEALAAVHADFERLVRSRRLGADHLLADFIDGVIARDGELLPA